MVVAVQVLCFFFFFFLINQRKAGPHRKVRAAPPFRFIEHEQQRRPRGQSAVHIHVNPESGYISAEERMPLRPTKLTVV